MGAREYAEWRAYEQVSGPLDLRDRLDVMGALISERITNMLRSGGKTATVNDFAPRWRDGKAGTDGDDPESDGQARDRG